MSRLSTADHESCLAQLLSWCLLDQQCGVDARLCCTGACSVCGWCCCRCLDVPDDCGSAPGKRCCPSGFGAITDKPLPSFGTGWEGSACSNETSIYGMYCSGG